IVATGEPCRKANESARLLRGLLNEQFAQRGINWVAYGDFSSWRLLVNYQGPRPTRDDFIPYNGDLNKLDGSRNPKLTHAFRIGMLLHGVDLAGLGGMTGLPHSTEDIEQTVEAVLGTYELLREEGLV